MENKLKYIMDNLHDKLEWLETNTNYNVAYVALQGSQNYGLDVYTDEYQSDIDAKAIIVPTLYDVVMGKDMVSKVYVMDDNSHIEVKDIRLYLGLWKKANPTYLEILFTDYYIINNCLQMYHLRSMAERIATMNLDKMISAIKGMAHQKFNNIKKVSEHNKDVIAKYGYDPKEYHHLHRLALFLDYMFYSYCYDFKHALFPNDRIRKMLIDEKLGKDGETLAALKTDQLIHRIDAVSGELKKLNLQFKEETYIEIEKIIFDIIQDNIKKELKIK